LLLDGVNSIEYAQKLEDIPDVEPLKIFVLDDPARSILRATFRNCINKNIKLDDTLERKLKEYFYMWIWMLRNMEESDVIAINKEEKVLPKQIEMYRNLFQRKRGIVRDKVHKIINAFGTKIEKYPQRFSHFSLVLSERINDIVSEIDS